MPTKYSIYYPGEDKPRGDPFDFMSEAAMFLLCQGVDAQNAEIKPVDVPEEGGPKTCE